MSQELSKRIITSILLISLLTLTFFNTYILIISLILIVIISWIEFNGLISKIIKEENLKTKITILIYRVFSILYLLVFSILIFNGVSDGISEIEPKSRLNIFYLFSICVFSDMGGLFFGKTFKGKKLTKISPNKTISGSIGSFILSISLAPLFYYIFDEFNNLQHLIILSIIISLICQLGDLFISYLKRNAKVKDTGNLLPGHGGVLDRIDGILFAVPAGMMLWKILQ